MSAIERLLEIMAMLRDPEQGCPWDREQTHQSLIPYLLEESHEVIGAIEQGDAAHLRDELGDLLFQVVFHARIAEEACQFNFADIADTLAEKLIRRHPHVFEAENYSSDAEREAAWEKLKQNERRNKEAEGASILDGISDSLPSLMRAEKLQHRAAHAGFDWPDLRPVLAKIEEELAEVGEAMENAEGKERIEEEIGDLLFVVANLARHAGIKPEEALRKTNEKFIRRFRQVEEGVAAEGMNLQDASLEQMEVHWQNAKQSEKQAG